MTKGKKSKKTTVWGQIRDDLKDGLKGFDEMFQKPKGKKGGIDSK